MLVRSLREQVEAALEQTGVKWHDTRAGTGANPGQQGQKVGVIFGASASVALLQPPAG